MKNLIYLFISTIAFSCTSENGPIAIDNSDLVGKWKLTEAFISAGGPQFWAAVEDGEELIFFANGTFTSSRFPECASGVFFVDATQLMLDYNCEGFVSESENEEGFITFDLDYQRNQFIATPTSGPMCIEGCSYKYQKE